MGILYIVIQLVLTSWDVTCWCINVKNNKSIFSFETKMESFFSKKKKKEFKSVRHKVQVFFIRHILNYTEYNQ